jgi:hypothetical protein
VREAAAERRRLVPAEAKEGKAEEEESESRVEEVTEESCGAEDESDAHAACAAVDRAPTVDEEDDGDVCEDDEAEVEEATEEVDSDEAEEMMEDSDPEELEGDMEDGEDDEGDEVTGEVKAADSIAKPPLSFASISSFSGPSTSSTE